MFIFQNYFSVLRKYFTFTGRAGRAEFWWFICADLLIFLGVCSLEALITDSQFSWSSIFFESYTSGNFYSLITVIPALAVSVRRLHDVNKDAVWFLVPFYNLYLFTKRGTSGPNRYR